MTLWGSKETRTDALCTRLIIQSEIARWAHNAAERSQALMRLSQTLFNITRPKFHKQKLIDALKRSCIEQPDYGSAVAAEGKKLYLNGTFDLDMLSHAYFAEAAITIEGKVVDEKDA